MTTTTKPTRTFCRSAIAGLAALLLAAAAAPAAATAQAAPKFTAYPVGQVYTGPAKPVDFASNKVTRALRPVVLDIIREQVAKGANFAGAYRLVTVGCGTACQAVLAIDLRTGRIYSAPQAASAGVAFRRASRLVRFNADPGHGTPARFYVFRKGRFVPVR